MEVNPPNVSRYFVRDEFDWTEFFVSEPEPKAEDNGRLRHSATWCAIGSYGVYGHFWSHMGEPFAEFIQDNSANYLLSKIARTKACSRTTIKSVRRAVLQSRRDGAITKDVARDAFDAIAEIDDDYGESDGVGLLLYQDHRLHDAKIEWTDLTTTDYDQQAVMFAKRIWPKFVKAVAEPIRAATGRNT